MKFALQEGENLTREQIEEDIRKIKAEHAEDEGTSLSSSLNEYFLFFLIVILTSSAVSPCPQCVLLLVNLRKKLVG